MIKRIGNIIIALLLVFSTSGITVYKHYCGNNYEGKSLIFTPKNCCKGECRKCHNQATLLKVKDIFEKTSYNLNSDINKITYILLKINLILSYNNISELKSNSFTHKRIKSLINTSKGEDNLDTYLSVFRI